MNHTEIQMDPDEQENLRYRLFARAIRINGLSQISALQPYLQAGLKRIYQDTINPHIKTDGMLSTGKL